MKTTLLKTLILGALIANASAANATNTMSENSAHKGAIKWEQCYGIAKAGHNSCPPGSSKVDGDANAFINLPEGTCNKIVGGVKK